MKKPPVNEALRQIGWDLWDPIGLKDMEGGWKGRPFEDEYDRYMATVAEMLGADCSDEEAIKYLFDIESVSMSMTWKKLDIETHARLLKVVTAVRSALEGDRR